MLAAASATPATAQMHFRTPITGARRFAAFVSHVALGRVGSPIPN